jgi:membrane associated rhomboid family serine protease
VGQKCLECSAPVARARVIHARDLRQTTGAPVTMTILVACVAVFIAGAYLGLGGELLRFGAQINAAVAEGQWYRLFTSAFLHRDLVHILFNMWALYVFGPHLERRAGSLAFAALYFSSAVAGGAAFFALGSFEGAAVGASGAIFGLFGAVLADAVRHRHTLAGRANLNQLLLLLIINAALPLVVPGIAWQAHLGGLVTGFVICMTWAGVGEQRGRSLARALIAVAVGAVTLGFVLL